MERLLFCCVLLESGKEGLLVDLVGHFLTRTVCKKGVVSGSDFWCYLNLVNFIATGLTFDDSGKSLSNVTAVWFGCDVFACWF